MKVARGRRVHVMPVNIRGKALLNPGYGTYLGEVPLRTVVPTLRGRPAGNYPTPRIKLDSGQTVYGFMCYWRTELLPLRLPTS